MKPSHAQERERSLGLSRRETSVAGPDRFLAMGLGWLVAGICANVAVLLFFKYANPAYGHVDR